MFSFDATLVLLELVISKDHIYSVIEALSSNYRDLYTFGLIIFFFSRDSGKLMCSRDETSQSIHCETFSLSTKSQTSLHYVITHILDRLLVPEMVTPQSSYGLRGHSEPEKGVRLA
jgi:hypothetical protein